ncbi:hypothetical protein [Tychonema sp. LEGE 07203]|uniref:hypothetical protein n=1 Tax=Tychonema sp. LEGE 07203 TaxID=1828671 RepID=UPI00188306C5|nr:hypothetical protein [Tychonema sp. LEGE 07203]MBE9096485.1 hypothetical protein [Tychonema sp. LEGE 07203]
MVFFFVAVAVFLAVVFFATVFSVAVSDFTAAVLVGFFDLLLAFPLLLAGLYGEFADRPYRFFGGPGDFTREVIDWGFVRANAH